MSDERFSEDERGTLGALLDVLIPPSRDGAMPCPSSLGLVPVIASAIESVEGMRALVGAGLAALEETARARGAACFAELAPATQREVVDSVSEAHPALIPPLVYHTYSRYYEQGPVLEGLGLEARPPHPLGFEVEEGDLALLDPVRERGPIYRD